MNNECQHTFVMFKKKNSAGVYYCQLFCLECGKSGGVVKIPDIIESIEELTTEMQEKLNSLTKIQYDKINQDILLKREEDRKEWFREYNIYLNSDVWKKKRDLVLNRDSYICQGCLEVKANHVHHNTYSNVGDELLFQLISLCQHCHSKLHNHMEV